MSVQPNQTFPSFSSLNDSFLRGRELHMKYHVCTINQTFPALSSLNKSFTRGREPRERHHVCTIKPNFSPHFVALMTHSTWARASQEALCLYNKRLVVFVVLTTDSTWT